MFRSRGSHVTESAQLLLFFPASRSELVMVLQRSVTSVRQQSNLAECQTTIELGWTPPAVVVPCRYLEARNARQERVAAPASSGRHRDRGA